MEPLLNDRLLKLNQSFYAGYAQSFSSTRYSIQPGIQKLLPSLLQKQNILDLGCGNGNLAKALIEESFKGNYTGTDNSLGLLHDAQRSISPQNTSQYSFFQADLASQLPTLLPESRFDAIATFAVLHHFPETPYLERFFTFAKTHLQPSGMFYLSSWQVKNNQRLRNRIQDWSIVGLNPSDMDENDLLLDWRADPNQPPRYRYVRHYDETRLQNAGNKAGLNLKDQFYSDGKEGNLALYQLWQKGS